jgi:bifunctional non-homologous end joining protein LigD
MTKHQLLVAPYSVRPVPGATVSMPLTWAEVVPGLEARQFHIGNAVARAEAWGAGGDPCAPVLTERADLRAALQALGEAGEAGEAAK